MRMEKRTRPKYGHLSMAGLFWCIFILIFGLRIAAAHAAEIAVVSDAVGIKTGDEFLVDVSLDTDESINVVAGTIVLPTQMLELEDIRDGNSVVSFWIERPDGSITESSGVKKIRFAGLIPGGFVGHGGLLFSIRLLAKYQGSGTITVDGATTLRSDGEGSPASLTVIPFPFFIAEGTPGSARKIAHPQDVDPPESFEPFVTRDPALFEGKYFLVFTTQDKTSGIAYYAVAESPSKKLPSADDWKRAQSPYVLTDQELKSYLYVKAVDRAGHERIATLRPQNSPSRYAVYFLWGILFMGGLMSLTIAVKKYGEIHRFQR